MMDIARPVGIDVTAEEDLVARAGWAIRRAGERLDASPMFHREQLRKFRIVPDEMRRVGDYLERRRMRGVKLDAERVIVARPLVALLVAVVAGWAAGRAIRS
jgi:hypothetical protein